MADNSPGPDDAWAPADMRADLEGALDARQFFLVYQPTIDLQTNAFAGVEALLRWRHPHRGVVAPEAFLAELEASGQITLVGRWILATACGQGAEWHDRGYRFAVSVNVAASQLDGPGLRLDVEDALAASGFDPALLVLELPFAALVGDEAATLERLSSLRASGVRLSIDDFSPAEHSLAMIERFPIDVIKLDRAFIARVDSPSSTTLVQRLVELAKSRHLQVIASGIEDAEQRTRLQIDEVNIGQGYLFSKPHEAEEIDRYLEDFSIFSGKPL